jgi:hypothetical protein
MIEQWWSKLSRKFPLIETDAHVVMPNHFHGIIMIVGADPCVCPNLGAHKGAHIGAPLVRLRAYSHREVQVLSRSTLQPVTDCNCVVVRRGGEQQEVNDQSVG